ncbi:MAG: ASKHA domain-containing protein [Lachnospiraceae bacterium]|nr:ASKHA domain-containing protein [Lachnospiraceae bacterium]
MSEKIKITIVMNDEKPNGINEGESAGEMTLTQASALTLMPVLLKNGLMDGSFCGGRGDCGRCVVRFLKGAPLPTGLERSRLEPEELRQGYRLACVARPKTDCTIKIIGAEEADAPIVTEINLLSEKIDLSGRENSLSENQKSAAMEPDTIEKHETRKGIKTPSVILKKETDVIESLETGRESGKKKSGRYISAVDLGTTTIAMQLRNLDTGAVENTYCERNPQRIYGTDVLARIQASVEGHGEELRILACGAILRGLGQFTEYLRTKTGAGALQEEGDGENLEELQGGTDKCICGEIICMCIAGNTAMGHLLLGYDVASLGKAPFVPVETGLQKVTAARLFMGMENLPACLRIMGGEPLFDCPVYIVPCISAFVGGDVVAGLYVQGLLSSGISEDSGDAGMAEGAASGLSGEKPAEREPASGRQAVLFIDLGTNGEMAITDGRRMIVTATAAGPAFEGNGAVIGTDRIALTAELLRRGILDETGLLEEPYFTEGVRIENGKGAAASENQDKNMRYFKRADIRALQMAKAAVRAGVEILWEEMERPEIGQVCLAGGFGYYLDVEAAVSIGLLPSYMRGRVRAVGNTSLAGAYELARDLCGKRLDVAGLEARTGLAESINLAESERFEGLYLKYMSLGEN